MAASAPAKAAAVPTRLTKPKPTSDLTADDVAGGAGHEIARPVGAVEGRRIRLQRRVEIVAEVVLHALRAAHEREA